MVYEEVEGTKRRGGKQPLPGILITILIATAIVLSLLLVHKQPIDYPYNTYANKAVSIDMDENGLPACQPKDLDENGLDISDGELCEIGEGFYRRVGIPLTVEYNRWTDYDEEEGVLTYLVVKTVTGNTWRGEGEAANESEARHLATQELGLQLYEIPMPQ